MKHLSSNYCSTSLGICTECFIFKLFRKDLDYFPIIPAVVHASAIRNSCIAQYKIAGMPNTDDLHNRP